MISRSHPLARRLRQLRSHRAARDAAGVYVAEGVHLAGEALRSAAAVELAVVAPRLRATESGRALEAAFRASGIPCHEASDDLLDALQDARSPQPVLLVVRRPRALRPDDLARERPRSPLIVVCCGVQDPGNLGGILRSAEAAGATGAIVTGEGADLYHPRTVRATMGSIYRLRIAVGPAEEALDALREAGVATLAAVPGGRVAYDAVDWRQPSAVLFGGEGGGLSAELVAAADATVGIPMAAGVESLSVSAAAAVVLFEAARARRD